MKRCNISDPNSEDTYQWDSPFGARSEALNPRTLLVKKLPLATKSLAN
ncbi:hypothetical protein [Lusitaniella coriacea]